MKSAFNLGWLGVPTKDCPLVWDDSATAYRATRDIEKGEALMFEPWPMCDVHIGGDFLDATKCNLGATTEGAKPADD